MRKQYQTRQLRASHLGQCILKKFGSKAGRKLIKSLTAAVNDPTQPYDISFGSLACAFTWRKTAQGHKFWQELNKQL